MIKRRIQNECRTHNSTLRQVQHKYYFTADEFLRSSQGNLLINGGSAAKRMEVLKKIIVKSKQKSDEPIVIFGSDIALKNNLISLAQNGSIGRLFVCSEEYKNYDFFRGMNSNLIADYFSSVALEKGYRDTSGLHDYVGSFINILETQAEVNLASMIAFSKNSDTDIANIVKTNGNESDYELLIGSAKGGIDFRRLLKMVNNAFNGLTAENCSTGLNINSIINSDCIMYINTASANYELLSLYFLQELKQVSNKSFTVIFDDCILLNNSSLQAFTEVLKQRSNITLITSIENIMSVKGDEKLDNYSRQMIFLNGAVSASDLQSVLNSLGEYTHFEMTTSSGTPPRLLFSLLKSENNGITPYARPKILIEEEACNEAVLRGHDGPQIVVARRLMI